MSLQLVAHLLDARIERVLQPEGYRRLHQRIPRAARTFVGPLRNRSRRARRKIQGARGGPRLATVSIPAVGASDGEARIATTDEQTIKRREQLAQLRPWPLLR